MCALFGWLDYRGMIPHWVLNKLTQKLANAAEERGTDATGIAYIKDSRVTIFKRPKAAHKIRFNVPNHTKCVMGHTRFATQGDQHQNYNNHPFYGKADKAFALAHNGVLLNDTELRWEKNLPSTHIETDSYIAVQLIEAQKMLDFSSLRSMAEDVLGNFTFTVLDEENMLWFVKGSNPLYLIHFSELGLYVYASTQTIMAKALHKTPFSKMHFEVIDTEDGDIIQINPKGKITRNRFQPMFVSERNGYAESKIAGLRNEYGILLDMCGYFGVTEDEVEYLIEMGYSYDEIEAFLLNPAALDEEYYYSEL